MSTRETVGGATTSLVTGVRPGEVRLLSPAPYQVIQREGFDPGQAHAQGPQSALGTGDLAVILEREPAQGAHVECRLVPQDGAFGLGTNWTALSIEGSPPMGSFRAPAGGWYRLEVRETYGGAVVAVGCVEPVGVGEVFLVAGQSYADNCNDQLMRVEESCARVSVFDPRGQTWRVAHDPQPTPSDSSQGSIWPPFGDVLVPFLRVPVGMVNVAVGGTASSQWLPGKELHTGLCEAGLKVGRFRYVLWQQGESDAIGRVSGDSYVRNVTAIRDSACEFWGFSPTWLPAKSTYHPTVYCDPEGENTIRAAVGRLWETPGFAPGPDTDILGGENRGPMESQRHFSPVGQQRAALMWFAAVWSELNRTGAPSKMQTDRSGGKSS